MWIILGLLIFGGFGLGALLGAPYLPILAQEREELLDLAALKPGQTILDLGCGDGTLLRAAARRGVRAIGYEINPLLFLLAWLLCLPQRQQISVRFGDFWRANWPPSDIIYVFLIERYMLKLDRELNSRLSKSTKVVSYVFAIPGRQAVRSNKNAWVYDYPISVK